MSDLSSPFAIQLAKNITAKVRALLKDDTVGMSEANLRQVVPTPSHTLKGAPNGTNAPFYYRQLFSEVLAAQRLPRAFELIK